MNSRGAVKHRLRRARVVEPTISPDSLLEGNGFDKLPLRDGLCRLRDRSRSRKRFILSRQGTESSNLICSSGESANHGLGQARVPADAPVSRERGAQPARAPVTSRTTSCRSPVAVLMRSLTYSGRRSAIQRQRMNGRGRVRSVAYRRAACSTLYRRPASASGSDKRLRPI